MQWLLVNCMRKVFLCAIISCDSLFIVNGVRTVAFSHRRHTVATKCRRTKKRWNERCHDKYLSIERENGNECSIHYSYTATTTDSVPLCTTLFDENGTKANDLFISPTHLLPTTHFLLLSFRFHLQVALSFDLTPILPLCRHSRIYCWVSFIYFIIKIGFVISSWIRGDAFYSMAIKVHVASAFTWQHKENCPTTTS